PRVLAVGDLHVENFGTWRDSDGRLVWGVNDFDEADDLPYTNDLVRLAASVRFARTAGVFHVKFGRACAALLRGYRHSLEVGGEPFVLEERHPELRALAMAKERNPVRFWNKLTRLLDDAEVDLPTEAKSTLLHDLPTKSWGCEFRYGRRVGLGGLGGPGFGARAGGGGGGGAGETRAAAPPATAWAAGRDSPSRMAEVARNAVRCPDPF